MTQLGNKRQLCVCASISSKLCTTYSHIFDILCAVNIFSIYTWFGILLRIEKENNSKIWKHHNHNGFLQQQQPSHREKKPTNRQWCGCFLLP